MAAVARIDHVYLQAPLIAKRQAQQLAPVIQGESEPIYLPQNQWLMKLLEQPGATNFPRDVYKLLILWWALQDSNLRLPPCEGGTLPLS
jgi:hypothetical protein